MLGAYPPSSPAVSTRAGTGLSVGLDAYGAGRDAATAAVAGLGGPPDLLLVFATTRYPQARLLEGVRSVAPGATLVGCSGEGVISGGRSEERERAVCVMAVRSATLRFASVLVREYGDDPVGCGTRLAEWVAAQGVSDALALLVFPDGLVGDCTGMLSALESGLPGPIPILGGTAADAMSFEATYQYAGAEVASGSVSALLISGVGSVQVAVSHGCQRLGSPRRVTRAEGGWVHEIDGASAWSVFKEYLDGEPQDLNAEGVAHLCIGESLAGAENLDYGPLIIRTPLRLDAATGSLFFPGGGLPEGALIHLTRRDPERVVRSGMECARAVAAPRAPLFVLQVDCCGRGKALFGRSVSTLLVQPLREVLGVQTPWAGFHGYGEIAGVAGRARYHNYAVVLFAVSDAEPP